MKKAKTKKQMIKDYHKRKEKFRIPSYILFLISIILLVVGYGIKDQASLIFGFTLLGASIILYCFGDSLHSWVFRK